MTVTSEAYFAPTTRFGRPLVAEEGVDLSPPELRPSDLFRLVGQSISSESPQFRWTRAAQRRLYAGGYSEVWDSPGTAVPFITGNRAYIEDVLKITPAELLGRIGPDASMDDAFVQIRNIRSERLSAELAAGQPGVLTGAATLGGAVMAGLGDPTNLVPLGFLAQSKTIANLGRAAANAKSPLTRTLAKTGHYATIGGVTGAVGGGLSESFTSLFENDPTRTISDAVVYGSLFGAGLGIGGAVVGEGASALIRMGRAALRDEARILKGGVDPITDEVDVASVVAEAINNNRETLVPQAPEPITETETVETLFGPETRPVRPVEEAAATEEVIPGDMAGQITFGELVRRDIRRRRRADQAAPAEVMPEGAAAQVVPDETTRQATHHRRLVAKVVPAPLIDEVIPAISNPEVDLADVVPVVSKADPDIQPAISVTRRVPQSGGVLKFSEQDAPAIQAAFENTLRALRNPSTTTQRGRSIRQFDEEGGTFGADQAIMDVRDVDSPLMDEAQDTLQSALFAENMDVVGRRILANMHPDDTTAHTTLYAALTDQLAENTRTVGDLAKFDPELADMLRGAGLTDDVQMERPLLKIVGTRSKDGSTLTLRVEREAEFTEFHALMKTILRARGGEEAAAAFDDLVIFDKDAVDLNKKQASGQELQDELAARRDVNDKTIQTTLEYVQKHIRGETAKGEVLRQAFPGIVNEAGEALDPTGLTGDDLLAFMRRVEQEFDSTRSSAPWVKQANLSSEWQSLKDAVREADRVFGPDSNEYQQALVRKTQFEAQYGTEAAQRGGNMRGANTLRPEAMPSVDRANAALDRVRTSLNKWRESGSAMDLIAAVKTMEQLRSDTALTGRNFYIRTLQNAYTGKGWANPLRETLAASIVAQRISAFEFEVNYAAVFRAAVKQAEAQGIDFKGLTGAEPRTIRDAPRLMADLGRAEFKPEAFPEIRLQSEPVVVRSEDPAPKPKTRSKKKSKTEKALEEIEVLARKINETDDEDVRAALEAQMDTLYQRAGLGADDEGRMAAESVVESARADAEEYYSLLETDTIGSRLMPEEGTSPLRRWWDDGRDVNNDADWQAIYDSGDLSFAEVSLLRSVPQPQVRAWVLGMLEVFDPTIRDIMADRIAFHLVPDNANPQVIGVSVPRAVADFANNKSKSIAEAIRRRQRQAEAGADILLTNQADDTTILHEVLHTVMPTVMTEARIKSLVKSFEAAVEIGDEAALRILRLYGPEYAKRGQVIAGRDGTRLEDFTDDGVLALAEEYGVNRFAQDFASGEVFRMSNGVTAELRDAIRVIFRNDPDARYRRFARDLSRRVLAEPRRQTNLVAMEQMTRRTLLRNSIAALNEMIVQMKGHLTLGAGYAARRVGQKIKAFVEAMASKHPKIRGLFENMGLMSRDIREFSTITEDNIRANYPPVSAEDIETYLQLDMLQRTQEAMFAFDPVRTDSLQQTLPIDRNDIKDIVANIKPIAGSKLTSAYTPKRNLPLWAWQKANALVHDVLSVNGGTIKSAINDAQQEVIQTVIYTSRVNAENADGKAYAPDAESRQHARMAEMNATRADFLRNFIDHKKASGTDSLTGRVLRTLTGADRIGDAEYKKFSMAVLEAMETGDPSRLPTDFHRRAYEAAYNFYDKDRVRLVSAGLANSSEFVKNPTTGRFIYHPHTWQPSQLVAKRAVAQKRFRKIVRGWLEKDAMRMTDLAAEAKKGNQDPVEFYREHIGEDSDKIQTAADKWAAVQEAIDEIGNPKEEALVRHVEELLDDLSNTNREEGMTGRKARMFKTDPNKAKRVGPRTIDLGDQVMGFYEDGFLNADILDSMLRYSHTWGFRMSLHEAVSDRLGVGLAQYVKDIQAGRPSILKMEARHRLVKFYEAALEKKKAGEALTAAESAVVANWTSGKSLSKVAERVEPWNLQAEVVSYWGDLDTATRTRMAERGASQAEVARQEMASRKILNNLQNAINKMSGVNNNLDDALMVVLYDIGTNAMYSGLLAKMSLAAAQEFANGFLVTPSEKFAYAGEMLKLVNWTKNLRDTNPELLKALAPIYDRMQAQYLRFGETGESVVLQGATDIVRNQGAPGSAARFAGRAVAGVQDAAHVATNLTYQAQGMGILERGQRKLFTGLAMHTLSQELPKHLDRLRGRKVAKKSKVAFTEIQDGDDAMSFAKLNRYGFSEVVVNDLLPYRTRTVDDIEVIDFVSLERDARNMLDSKSPDDRARGRQMLKSAQVVRAYLVTMIDRAIPIPYVAAKSRGAAADASFTSRIWDGLLAFTSSNFIKNTDTMHQRATPDTYMWLGVTFGLSAVSVVLSAALGGRLERLEEELQTPGGIAKTLTLVGLRTSLMSTLTGGALSTFLATGDTVGNPAVIGYWNDIIQSTANASTAAGQLFMGDESARSDLATSVDRLLSRAPLLNMLGVEFLRREAVEGMIDPSGSDSSSEAAAPRY